MVKRMALTIVLVVCIAFPAMAEPSKEDKALLKKCIQAYTNLSKVSKEAGYLLLDVRKGKKADVKQYKGLKKSVKQWSNAVPDRCKDIDDLLAGKKKAGGVDEKGVMGCYREYEKNEDGCVQVYAKKMKKHEKNKKGQLKALDNLKQCVRAGQKPLRSCVLSKAGGKKKAVKALNTEFKDIHMGYEKCWNACWEKNMKEANMTEICDNKCQKESDRKELRAIKAFLKEAQ